MKNNIKIKIGRYEWCVSFIPKEEIGENTLGSTYSVLRQIVIRDDLDRYASEITLAHELTHALLDTQGRCYQKDFNVEEICELFGWCVDDIVIARDYVIQKRFGDTK